MTVFEHREATDPTARGDAETGDCADGDATESGRSEGGDHESDDRRLRELERENERLGRLFDVLAHDLRNHLAVAEGRLELATRDRDDDHLRDIARAHDRMSELLEDLLAARVEGFGVGECRAVALTACVDRAWAVSATGDAAVVVDGDLTLSADPDRLVQLLENLFRNSIEHGPTSAQPATGLEAADGADGGRSSIGITVGALPDGTGFFVEDDGDGLPADARGRLFEEGYSTAEDGTGLGLAIVRDVAAGHGWRVEATTGSAGGARFEISGVERPNGREDDLARR